MRKRDGRRSSTGGLRYRTTLRVTEGVRERERERERVGERRILFVVRGMIIKCNSNSIYSVLFLKAKR